MIGTIDVTNLTDFFAEIKALGAGRFFRVLKGLLNHIRVPGKIFLVGDNAPSHRAKKLRSFFKKTADRLQLVFLPSYSPDLKPIELLWRDLKKDVNTNEYFHTLNELQAALYKYLRQFKHPSEKIASLCNIEKFHSNARA